jgi:PEP-CTERM motif
MKMNKLTFLVMSVAALALFCFATPSAKAQTDPTIFIGSSSSASNDSPLSGGSETTDSWTYPPPSGVAVAGANSYVSFYNGTGSSWTSITIVATMDNTMNHDFTCDTSPFLSPPATYGTQAFSSCSTAPGPGPGTTTETYTFTGGSIGAGDYLVFSWNNFPTNSGNGPLNFAFEATATPEPSSLLLLGSGLLVIAFGARKKLFA